MQPVSFARSQAISSSNASNKAWAAKKEKEKVKEKVNQVGEENTVNLCFYKHLSMLSVTLIV